MSVLKYFKSSEAPKGYKFNNDGSLTEYNEAMSLDQMMRMRYQAAASQKKNQKKTDDKEKKSMAAKADMNIRASRNEAKITKNYKDHLSRLKKEDMDGMSQKSGDKRSTDSGAGMTAQGVAKYNRRTGGDLKTAVTTPPSKLKKGSKAAGRRKSFCARSKSWNGERGKAARARWNC